MVFQTEAAECGLACLAMIAGYHGLRVDLPALRHRFSVSLRGASPRGVGRPGLPESTLHPALEDGTLCGAEEGHAEIRVPA